MTHEHVFEAKGHTGPQKAPIVAFYCQCGERREQQASPELTKALITQDRDMMVMHRVKHEFDALFCPEGVWEITGSELMEAVEKWAEKHPTEVRICGIDDDHHTGSFLVLIEHRTSDRYMGTTSIVIPQCSGPPCRFFLYPGDRNGIIAALQDVALQAEPVLVAEEIHRRTRSELWQAEKLR